MSTPLSRRHVLGAGAAATAAASGASMLFKSVAAADAADPRGHTESIGDVQRLETLSTPAIGEEVRFYAAGSFTPNGSVAGTTLVFDSPRGSKPINGTGGSNYASVSVDVPVGSTLTSIEFVIEGTPQVGRVALLKYTPDQAVPLSYLTQTTITGAPTGITVYTTALTEVVDGNHTYEAFYTDNGTALTNSYCNGIRVRYRPPSNGLVPITPARAYDSRLTMTPDANGKLAAGTNRTVSVANARNITTGAVVAALVPSNATAVAYTLTVANTVGQGFLAVNPGGVTAVTASSINWSATGQLLANTGVVKLGPSQTVTVFAGGNTTDFIIDVVGYYL
jgi:hypothetical protein